MKKNIIVDTNLELSERFVNSLATLVSTISDFILYTLLHLMEQPLINESLKNLFLRFLI